MWTPNRTRRTTRRAFRPAADRLETREALSVVTPLLFHSNPNTNALNGQVVSTPAMTGGGFGSAAFNSGGGFFLTTPSPARTVITITQTARPTTTINPILIQTGGRTTSNPSAGSSTTSAALTSAFGAATGLTFSNPIPFLGPTGLGNGTVINPGVVTTSAGVGGTGSAITISPSGTTVGGTGTGVGTAAGTIAFPTM
jgi:hypothetical protein